MIMNASIKTYLRLDDMMMSTVLPTVTCGYHVQGHWLIWTIPTHRVTSEIKAWLGAQPDTAYAMVRFVGLFDGIVDDGVTGTHLAVGVSLSTATDEMVHTLYSGRQPMSLVQVRDTSKLSPTKHPLLFTDAKHPEFLYYKLEPKEFVPPVTPQVNSELVQKFKGSLKGHDFWYAYSDSNSVWKSGDADMKRLKDAGVEMGLTRTQVDTLYNEVYKELMKR